jgi:hypothetical protein
MGLYLLGVLFRVEDTDVLYTRGFSCSKMMVRSNVNIVERNLYLSHSAEMRVYLS